MADLEAIPTAPPLRRRSRARGSPTCRPSCSPRAGLRQLRLRLPAPVHDDHDSSADGERIAATVAMHDAPAPGLIVVHGLFSTRRFDYVRETAVRAFFEWGFNVAAVDLRSFGLTGLMNEAPSTGGWKEGEDLIAVAARAEAARRHQRRRAGDLAGRLLGARRLPPEGAEEALDGGILASRRRPTSGTRPSACPAPAAQSPRLRAQLRLPGDAALAGARLALARRLAAQRGPGPGQCRLLRARGGGDPAALLGRQPHRRRPGAGAGPASGGRPRDPGRATPRCSRGGGRQRPGARLDPARGWPRGARRRRPRAGPTPSTAVSSSAGPPIPRRCRRRRPPHVSWFTPAREGNAESG